MQKDTKMSFVKGISVVLLYFFMSFVDLKSIPFFLFHIDPNTLPKVFISIYLTCYQLLMLLVPVLIFKKELKEAWMDMKRNHKLYFQTYFKYWFLMLGIMMFSNLLIQIVMPNEIAGNEEAIRNMFKTSPIYTFISSVFIAPFLEEIVFRLGFRHIFSSDKLFIFISGIVFGSLHVIGNVSSALNLLYLIPYSLPGFIFAYVLTKSKNIFTTIGIHFVHNGVLMSLQCLLYFLI